MTRKPLFAPIRTAPGDDAVAFALAATVRRSLSTAELDQIYVMIGVGETFEAIEALLTAIACQRISIGADLVETAVRWLTFYCGHEAQPRLQECLAEIDAQLSQHNSSSDQLSGPEHRNDQNGSTC